MWGDADALALIQVNARSPEGGQAEDMVDNLVWLRGICTPDAALQGGLLLGLFITGLSGSVVHCGPMCGAFVLGQATERMARLPLEHLCEWQRVRTGLLLPYHLGRLTTYAGLGATAAGLTGRLGTTGLGHAAWLNGLSAILLTAAALLFLTQALGRVWPPAASVSRTPWFWRRFITRLTQQIQRGSVQGEYLLGVALGFLPCGLLYAAIAVAAASASGPMGAAAMVAFGIGTTPVLMLVGIAGHGVGWRYNRLLRGATPVLMAMNAVLLFVIALRRLS